MSDETMPNGDTLGWQYQASECPQCTALRQAELRVIKAARVIRRPAEGPDLDIKRWEYLSDAVILLDDLRRAAHLAVPTASKGGRNG